MGQKDISEKLLEDYNDVFADIVNVLLFDGKEVVSPDSLEQSKVRSQYKADDSKLHEQERDTVKYWKDEEVTIALYGLENQTDSEKIMPVRVIGYDGAAYRSQLLDKELKEYYPVVTIVLHFGKKRWEHPKNLKEVVHIPKALEQFVNDYRIHVFEIAWLSDEQVAKFKSDFRIVAEYFTQMRKNDTYQPSEREIRHVDAVLKLLSVFGEEEKVTALVKPSESKKEGKKMAGIIDRYIDQKLAERMAEQDRQMAKKAAEQDRQMAKKAAEQDRQMAKKAAEQDRQMAKKAAEQDRQMAEQIEIQSATIILDMIEAIQKNKKLSLNEALEALGKTVEEYERAKQIVKK